MKNFKDLNLDRTKLNVILGTFSDCKIERTKSTTSKDIYKITRDNIECILSVFKKDKGTTTLTIQGKNIELGNIICQKIKDEAVTCELSEINQSIIITDEHFEELIKLVNKNFKECITQKEVSGGISYIFQKPREGKFIFNFYTKSNKLLLQGKTLALFNFIVNILTNQGYDVLNKILSDIQDIKLEESKSLLDVHLPTLTPKLSKKVQDIITPSLQLIKVNINFSDYTIILFPALKTLEHIIINVLEENEIDYDTKKGFKMFSFWSPTNSYKLDTNITQFTDITKNRLEKCYTFYNKQRHGLFHLGSDITEIRAIETKEEALSLLFECIELMEDISDDFPS